MEEDEDVPLLHDISTNNSDTIVICPERNGPKPALLPQVAAVLVACIAPLSMGLVLGFSSPTNGDLKTVLTSTELTWYGSIITIGALAGGPLAGIMIGWLGRKSTLMICNLAFSWGWFLIIFPTNATPNAFVFLLIGRLLTGIGMGMCSLAAPVYIAEISTKELRGTFGAAFQLAVALGILVVFALGIPLQHLILYRRQWLAIACGCAPAIMIVAMLPLPEAPRWYVTKGKRQDALEALRWLRGKEYDIEEECLEIEANLAMQHGVKLRPLDLISKPALSRPLMISVALMIFQQGSGVNSIVFNAAQIFKTSGFAESNVAAVYIGLAQVIATGLSVVLMDIAGRRALLLIACFFMIISSATLGLFYYLTAVKGMDGLSWLSLTSLIVFILFFSLGWGPIPWLIMSEILPIKARGVASAIATSTNWLCAFIVTKEFHDLEGAVHEYGAFWFYGGISVLGMIFVAVFLPETKGKSLEEIEEHFEKRNQ